MMSISIRLVESNSQISRKINKAIAIEVNNRIRKRQARVKAMLRQSVINWVMQQPEINSLLAMGVPGSLNATFGLTNADSAVQAIANSVSSAMYIRFSKFSPTLSGSIEFGFQSKDFANLLGLPEGHQYTELGGDLHWLDWLLMKGDTTIVKGYSYKPSTKGRSRGGTMALGGVFRVNPRYSGSADNNFITRAFLGRNKELTTMLSYLLE